MDDLKTLGQSDIGYGFYYIRQGGPLGHGSQVSSIRIDPLGQVHVLATTSNVAGYTAEELAAMPTREEAIELHMAPAFAEAEARLKAEVERRRREGPPAPEPVPVMDPATARFHDIY